MKIKSVITALVLGSALVAGSFTSAYAADVNANDRVPLVVNDNFVQPALKTATIETGHRIITGQAFGENNKITSVYVTSNLNKSLVSLFEVNGVTVYASSDITASQINSILADFNIEGRVNNSEVRMQVKQAGLLNKLDSDFEIDVR